MFAAFEGKPNIVRLHGRGRVLLAGDPGFDGLAAQFPPNPGTRALIRIGVELVSTSCGFAVPFMDYKADRDTLDKWAAAKGPEALDDYRREKNVRSIDRLPALAPNLKGENPGFS